jgi:hypothetical protein
MLRDVYLTLMVGPAVPAPAPKEVIDALVSVEVTVPSRGHSGFQLNFSLSRRSPLETLFLLSAGAMPPIVRVIVGVTVNGVFDVLIDGVVTDQQVTTGQGAQPSTLNITGLDLHHVMSYMLWSNPPGTPYPGMPAEAIVLALVAKYSVLGIIPLVIPSVLLDFPNPLDYILLQEGSDLAEIEQLADEVGYTFYHKPTPALGVSFAYWGPEIKIGIPQPALNVDMDAYTNVESVNFRFDNTAKKLPILLYLNKESNMAIPIPVPDITPLSPPLGLIPPLPHEAEWLHQTAKYSFVQAAAIGLAKAAQSAQAVSATGTLDVLRYGRVLKSRELVGVRGVGTAFDGLYYVKSVTHNLKRGEYKQNFTLSRNGLISTVSEVSV